MADFTIRVVLHGATSQNYEDLHAAMARAGARRTIRGEDGVTYDLPDGEYVLVSISSVTQVREAVFDIASGVKASPSPSVLVTQSAGRSWFLRFVPGQS